MSITPTPATHHATPPMPPAQQTRRVRRLLEELGIGPGRPLRQGDVAAQLGVHRTHWSKICNGERLPVSGHPFGRWQTWDDFERDVRETAARLTRR